MGYIIGALLVVGYFVVQHLRYKRELAIQVAQYEERRALWLEKLG